MSPLNKVFASVLISVALIGCHSSSRTGYNPPPVGAIPPAGTVQPATLPWLLHIRGTVGTGTAFATTYRGTLGVMTAWHVVATKAHAGTVSNLGAVITMTFSQIDHCDIAWAAAQRLPISWQILQIAPGSPAIQDIVEAWGYPDTAAMGTQGPILNLDVQQRDKNMLAGKYLEVGAEVRPGMSGGPVLDSSHRVVAVICLSQISRTFIIDTETHHALIHEEFTHYPSRIP